MDLPSNRRKIIAWQPFAETMWIFAFRAPKLGWWMEVLLYLHASNRGPGIVSTDNELYLQRNYVVRLNLSERDRMGDAVQFIARL